MAPAAAQANGRKVSLSGMQLTDATGATAYYDVTFEFGVLADGNLGMRLTSASPSTFIQGSTFVAGNYSDPAGNIYRVTGPTPTATNRLEYNISLTTTTSSTGSKQGFEAQWQTGIVDGNPLLVDQYTKPNVGTSAGFGLSQSDAGYFSPSGDGFSWSSGYAIGATQTSPTTLKLNYYFGNKTPYRSVTLTKI